MWNLHQVVEVPEGLTVEALGSYRRGKADSGDCDVLLTHDDGVRCTSVPQMHLNTKPHTCELKDAP